MRTFSLWLAVAIGVLSFPCNAIAQHHACKACKVSPKRLKVCRLVRHVTTKNVVLVNDYAALDYSLVERVAFDSELANDVGVSDLAANKVFRRKVTSYRWFTAMKCPGCLQKLIPIHVPESEKHLVPPRPQIEGAMFVGAVFDSPYTEEDAPFRKRLAKNKQPAKLQVERADATPMQAAPIAPVQDTPAEPALPKRSFFDELEK